MPRKRKAKPMQQGAREPNGRLSRRAADVRDRDYRNAQEAMSVVIAARARLFGLTDAQARTQEGGTVVGRMYHSRELTADQVEAAFRYIDARNAYHRAIGAPSDTGRVPLPESASTGSYEEFCRAARNRWKSISDVLANVMMTTRSPAPVSALDHFVVRDVYLEHLVGDLCTALDALHLHFSGSTKGRR